MVITVSGPPVAPHESACVYHSFCAHTRISGSPMSLMFIIVSLR